MKTPFALRLALREGRSSARRLGVYMIAIMLGVAALVAINSFRAAITESLRAQSRALLGGDLQLSSSRPFPDSVNVVMDSLAAAGVPVSRVTGTLSVALAGNGNTRLVQVRAVTPGYPFYGNVETDPPGLWGTPDRGLDALVDPGLLIALSTKVGDSLHIGNAAFRIAGTLTRPPVEIGFRGAIAPRVYISQAWLQQANLIRFGSIVTYEAYLRLPDRTALTHFIEQHEKPFRNALVRSTTAEEQARSVSRGLDRAARFLGLVGLTALLLGGLGVGSAVHTFVREKREQIAVLRCIGATRRTAFLAYLFQAAALGLGGSLLGAALGVGVQALLPRLLGSAIPVTVAFHLYPREILIGLLMGGWVAFVFAWLPLLAVRTVTPLQALRHDVQPESRRLDPWRVLAWTALAASLVVLGVLQAPRRIEGVAFAGGLVLATLALRVVAWILMRASRRLLPRRASFAVRQGVSSLFRPANQTAAVTVALGFGVFLIATIWIVQLNLLDRIQLDRQNGAPDLVAFDIQSDQRDDVASTFASLGVHSVKLVPIVPARIAAIDGQTVQQLLARKDRRAEPWALRRDYRNTWRAALSPSETIVEGEWWDSTSAGRDTFAIPRVSVEEDVARTLGVRTGSRITWDLQGVQLETRVASLRRVDWARFDTNFFVVFEPGVIERAPQMWVALADIPDLATRAAVQRELVRKHANVTTLDLALVQQTVTGVINRVTLAIRFMALFAVIGGIIVLAGAIAAGGAQRARETVLLRTLGATRPVVRRVLFAEYAALGSLAGLAGTLLAAAAGWALMHWFFDLPFRLPVLPLVVGWLGLAALATAVGSAGQRNLLRGPPLAALRQAE